MRCVSKLSLIAFFLVGCAGAPKLEKAVSGEDARLHHYSYPYEVKSYGFKSQQQDVEMAYMDVIPKQGYQKTMVLFHGKNFLGAYFEDIIQKLSEKGYRVIVPDQIGFGKSSKPANYQYSFQQLAVNTDELLKSLKVEKFELFGHSMGGMLATRYALMFPDKVTKLYLVDPIGLEDWKTMTSYRTVDENYQAELKKTAEDIKQYQVKSYYDGGWMPKYQKWIEFQVAWLKGPDYPLIAWTSALTSDMIFTQPVFYEFKNLKMPVILMIGEKDRTAIGKAWALEPMKSRMGNYPAMGKQVAKMIPHAKLVLLPGVGHLPFVENFNEFWKAFEKQW